MSMDYLRSTYRADYKGESLSAPVVKYRKLPSHQKAISATSKGNRVRFAPAVTSLLPPKSQEEEPHIPSRNKASGLQQKSKPNVVFQTKFGPMDMDTINATYEKVFYRSCAKKAAAEYALPMHLTVPPNTTLEPMADMVKLRAQKYDKKVADWQDAVLWERLQTRLPTERPHTPPREKSVKKSQFSNCYQERQKEIERLSKHDSLSIPFERRCPGYAGYHPLCPPYSRLESKMAEDHAVSSKAIEYRKKTTNDDQNHVKAEHARTGVFSKTVTLTFPYNPYRSVKVPITDVMETSGGERMKMVLPPVEKKTASIQNFT